MAGAAGQPPARARRVDGADGPLASTGAGDAPPEVVATRSFEDFFEAEYRSVLAVIVALTGDWAAAEDVTQEAFATAFRKWDGIRDHDRPGAWVRRVAINRAISRGRRLTVEKRVLGVVRSRTADAAHDTLPDDELWTAVRNLPKRQAQVVALVYLDDLALAEVAETLGISVGAVKAHLGRARASLGRVLADDAAAPEEGGRHG